MAILATFAAPRSRQSKRAPYKMRVHPSQRCRTKTMPRCSWRHMQSIRSDAHRQLCKFRRNTEVDCRSPSQSPQTGPRWAGGAPNLISAALPSVTHMIIVCISA
jgi:hypothetical protein